MRVHVRRPSYTHGVNVAETILKGVDITAVSQILFSLDICPPDYRKVRKMSISKPLMA